MGVGAMVEMSKRGKFKASLGRTAVRESRSGGPGHVLSDGEVSEGSEHSVMSETRKRPFAQGGQNLSELSDASGLSERRAEC